MTARDHANTVRDALDVLYHFTSDAANPPGEGRSWHRANGRSALDALQAQAEAAQREADIQMGAKLAAQMTLKAVCDVLNLPMVSLGNGWTEATPKILARIETIVDEADRLAAERDALAEAQQFPVSTVMSWKRRAEGAEALMRYARLLLDPERQDDPDEENALRAYEVLSGRPLIVPVDADNQRFRDEAVSALLRAEAAEQRATELEAENGRLRETLARLRPDIDPDTGYGHREAV